MAQSKEFYEKAKKNIDAFIKEINPNLSVSIEIVKRPQSPNGEMNLVIKDKKDPKFNWQWMLWEEGGEEWLASHTANKDYVKQLYERIKAENQQKNN